MLIKDTSGFYRTIKLLAIVFFTYYIFINSIKQSKPWKVAISNTDSLYESISVPETIIINKDNVEMDNQGIIEINENTPNYKLSDAENPSDNVLMPMKELMKGPYVLSQDNSKLLEHIQNKILPPSKEPYNLDYPDMLDPSRGQSDEIKNILGEMRNGFFVECGALWGEQSSNTLAFERHYGWTGLLVEAKPKFYRRLLTKHRKAWSIHACISRKPYPNTVLFPRDGRDCCGKISDLPVSSNKKGYIEVQCLPFYSMLMALNTTTIDYFSLDVEGHELDVLKTIPWEKINIRTLTVEHSQITEGKGPLQHYMMSQGYYVYTPVSREKHIQGDSIFYRKDIIPKIQSPHI